MVTETVLPATLAGTLIMSSPLTKVTKAVAGIAVEFPPATLSVATLLAANELPEFDPLLTESDGNALKGKAAFDEGQLVMNALAIVNMALGESGVPAIFADTTSRMLAR